MSQSAPFHADLAEGPDGGRAQWVRARDGVRLRVGFWNIDTASSGTVLLFPGRTEFIEKYGRAAAALAQRGFATVAVDWRGQGLSDRLAPEPMLGHVGRFDDYQSDVAAMVEAARAAGAPQPWYLLAHSMGGAIGLRAVMQGLPVASCAFSGPMWGITLSPLLRPAAWALSSLAKLTGQDQRFAPGSGPEHYVLTEPFDSNGLTRDAEMYGYMQRQVTQQPDLGLGGPSLGWLYKALMEMLSLSRHPAPDLPGLTILGSDEAIVDPGRIQDRMAGWSNGRLHVEPGGRHELLMEDAQTQARLFDMICGFYRENVGFTHPTDAV